MLFNFYLLFERLELLREVVDLDELLDEDDEARLLLLLLEGEEDLTLLRLLLDLLLAL